MLQIVEQTKEEKMAMYMKLPKKQIAEMLINCNDIITALTQSKNCVIPAVMESLPHTQYRWVCGKCDFSSLELNWDKCPNCGNVP